MSNEKITRGTEDQFDELHGLTLMMLTRMMKAAAAGMLVDEEGQVTMPSPTLLAQAIKFLQANGIDRPDSGESRNKTPAGLPSFDDDDAQEGMSAH